MGNLRGFSSYEEEIWDRHESDIRDLGSYEQIVSWLISDSNGNIVRSQTQAIRDIARNLAKPYNILSDVEQTTSISKLNELYKDSNDIVVADQRREVQDTINSSIKRISQIEAERIAAQEEEAEALEEQEIESARIAAEIAAEEAEEEEQEELSMEVGERYILADQWRATSSERRRLAIENQLRELPYGGQVIGGLRRTKR